MEIMVVVSLLAIIGVGIGTYSYQGMKLWTVTRDHVAAQDNIRAAFRGMVDEIREAILSDNGSYPIESASDFALTFFANVDSDPNREKIKYELADGTLYRWENESDGSVPPLYPDFTIDDRTTVAENILNADYLFRYFDASYNGETDPLSDPFDLNEISLVQVKLIVDYDPVRTPTPLEVETNVSLRNLKYKYEN